MASAAPAGSGPGYPIAVPRSQACTIRSRTISSRYSAAGAGPRVMATEPLSAPSARNASAGLVQVRAGQRRCGPAVFVGEVPDQVGHGPLRVRGAELPLIIGDGVHPLG